jgi:hypothetical protein
MAYDSSKVRSIDRWRRDVAQAAEPVVIPSDDRSFRKGYEPAQVLIADGMDKYVPSPSTVDYQSARKTAQPRVRMVRRASSYDGDHSRRRSRRSPTRTVGAPTTRTSGGRRSSFQPTSVLRERDLPPRVRSPTTRSRTQSKPQTSLWSTLLPSSRSSRSRTIVYDTPPPRRRYTRSPPAPRRYVSTRISEPDRGRDRRGSASQPRRVVSRKETRRDSLDVDERMRLLDIRDRFREEVDRARRWQSVERPRRTREYDRRSAR